MDQPQATLTIDLAGDASPASASEDLVEQGELERLDLPEGATQQPDGSVHLVFETPATVTYTNAAGEVVRTDTIEHLVLRRLRGKQVRRAFEAKASRANDLVLSAATGLTEAKLATLYRYMEPGDLVAARLVVAELIDANGEGLPPRAQRNDDGSIVLTLRVPATDGDGTAHGALTFRKFKADALIAMQNAKDVLLTAVARATGLSPKAVDGLLDDMDGADLMGTQRVIGFLSGIGRRSGG